MPRLFVGIELPALLTDRLALLQGGIPGARWESADKYHLTLRFIGDADHGTMRVIERRLEGVHHLAFTLQLRGVGYFPPRGQPRSLWLGLADDTPLHSLKAQVDRTLSDLEIEPDLRRFAPHVTLARLRGTPRAKVMQYIGDHNLFVSEPFVVARFKLFSSVLSSSGSKYRVEAAYPLADPDSAF